MRCLACLEDMILIEGITYSEGLWLHRRLDTNSIAWGVESKYCNNVHATKISPQRKNFVGTAWLWDNLRPK